MTDESKIDGKNLQNGILEKRLEDLKWFIGVFSSSIAFLVAGLSVMVGFNLSSEKASLKNFKDEIRTEVRESLGRSAQPSLDLFSLDGRPLNGATIDAWLAPNSNGTPQIHFRWVAINKGKGGSGPMFMRFYSSNIPFPDPDTDNTGHKYSTFIDSPKFSPSVIPGGVSMPYTSHLEVPPDFKIVNGESSVFIRLYYADGETAQADCKLRAKK